MTATVTLALVEAFGLSEPVWIEHRPLETTDGDTGTFGLLALSTGVGPSSKPLDRATNETLLGAYPA